MLFPLIACNERFSRQPFFSTILCDMQMEGFKTVLPGANIALAWTGLQIKLLCTLRAASINSSEKMAALETHVVTVPRTILLDNQLDVSWFGQVMKPLSEFLSGDKSRKDKNPKERPSGIKNGSDNTDSNQSEDNPNEPADDQEPYTYGESGDTHPGSPSNGAAGATGDDGGGDDGDGDDGDGSRKGRDDGRFEMNRTNERTNQTNHNLEALENFWSLNRSLSNGQEEDVDAGEHDDDPAEDYVDNADVEDQNNDAGEPSNQEINIMNGGVFESISVNGFRVQEQKLDLDDHHYIDNESRENGPIRSRIQMPYDDDDDDEQQRQPIVEVGIGVQEQGLDMDDHHYINNDSRENGPIRSRIQMPYDDDDDDKQQRKPIVEVGIGVQEQGLDLDDHNDFEFRTQLLQEDDDRDERYETDEEVEDDDSDDGYEADDEEEEDDGVRN